MKNNIKILFVLIILLQGTIVFSTDLKIFLSLSGNLRFSPGYEYKYSELWNPATGTSKAEYMELNEKVLAANIYSPVISIGLDYKSFEFLLALNPFSGEYDGSYEFVHPIYIFTGYVSSDTKEGKSQIKGVNIEFNVTYKFNLTDKVKPYVSAGLSYLTNKIDLLRNLTYRDIFQVNIEEIEFQQTSVNTLGGMFGVGINAFLTENISIFLEGKYIFAKKDVPHPLWSNSDPIHLKFGGAGISIGTKYYFEIAAKK